MALLVLLSMWILRLRIGRHAPGLFLSPSEPGFLQLIALGMETIALGSLARSVTHPEFT
jgi:hypothetical protein